MKVISGAQNGVDRAALDAAMQVGLDWGGYIPKGRICEGGRVPDKYDRLEETCSSGYKGRTVKNIAAAQATLVIYFKKLSGGTLFTASMVEKAGKPILKINLAYKKREKAKEEILKWIRDNQIEILNVAGPRASKIRSAHSKTFELLLGVFQELKKERSL